uniref:Uncharacterized protein n=1 Tax=Siphoviridae sp. ctXQq5 TaxID=2826368 RepID=A0A8S5N1R5_9CAUD|nr:MAG TPA: hypothetical protein [Siphoviridae sp. ctXQq5]
MTLWIGNLKLRILKKNNLHNEEKMKLLSLMVIGALLWWIADSLNDIKNKK